MDKLKTKVFSTNVEYKREISDIYSGEESMRFKNRHPIYKSLMKIEFEDVLRNFNSQMSQ